MAETHTFAWNDLSFEVPSNWNLSAHHTFKGVTTLSLEDEYELRLDLEWTRVKAGVDLDTVRKRYAKASATLVEAAEKSFPIRGVPVGWSAVRYRMADERELVVAYYFEPRSRTFCFFQFHFTQDSIPRPLPALKIVTRSFCVEDGQVLPWRFYDVAFDLDRDFKLSMSSLRAGRKLLLFEWRLRRFFVWHFSLADMILEEKDLMSWAIEVLDSFKAIRGPRFKVAANGSIAAFRRWRYPFGHYEEIGRQCFRYHGGVKHLRDKNQIVLWIYQYRNPADLRKIEDGFVLPED